MVELRPFRGLRYAAEAGEIGRLVAPPSESLDAVTRESYADRSPHNVVRLASPEGKDDDRSRYVRYARAMADLMAWRREGLLVAEDAPAFYRVRQRIGDLSRTGIIAVVRSEEIPALFAAPVHAHDDRLRLLEATRTYTEIPVAAGDLTGVEGLAGGNPISVRTEDGVETILEPIYAVDEIGSVKASNLVLIDGAESWRAAREFASEGWAPIAIFPRTSVVLTPVYRVLGGGAASYHDFLSRLSPEVKTEEHHSSRLYDLLQLARRAGNEAAAISFEGGRGYLLTGPNALASAYEATGVRDPGKLRTLGDHHLAIRAVEEGAGAAFLSLAPTFAEAMGKAPLPYRSATSFPRLPSGLVMFNLADEVSSP